ncbi:MAG: NUDIX hydrolase [Planctomycetota bacterium]
MFRFCPNCGAPCEARVPAGDDRARAVCTACAAVHYTNPNAVVGCIVEAEGGVLLCRRAIEPAHGRWTFPAGFLENGESLAAGAARETWEEAHARVQVSAPHALLDIPHIAQTYVVFRARLLEGGFGPGPESLHVEVVALDAIPWDELAFPSVALALRLYVEDRSRGVHHVHQGVVHWTGAGSRYDLTTYELRAHRADPLA